MMRRKRSRKKIWKKALVKVWPVWPIACLFTVAAVPDPAFAAENAVAPCDHEVFRQFDFMLGVWRVVHPDTGDELGRNTLKAVVGGCAISENWEGAGGVNGESLTMYDWRSRELRQFWVDNSGMSYLLSGSGGDPGQLQLRGAYRDQHGDVELSEVSWIANDDGTISQSWRISDDGGNTWNTVFLGLYFPENHKE